MSMPEVERFAASLNANRALWADAEKFEASANQSQTPLARMIEK